VKTSSGEELVGALAQRNRIWSRSHALEYTRASCDGGIIDLAQGYLREPAPAHIAAAAQEAMERGETHYVDHAGLEPLRAALAAGLCQAGEAHLEPADILVTSGAQEALFVTLHGLLQPGDQVLVPDPGYTPVEPIIELAGGTVVRVPTGGGFAYSAANLSACISPATRLVVLVSPNPATAQAIAPEQYAGILDVARQHRLTVVLDAALEQGLYEPAGRPCPADYPRLILIGSVSKLYRMSGWRIGWIAARPELIWPLKTFKQMLSICSSSISQWAALAAITGPHEWLVHQRAELARRRDVAVEVLSSLGFPTVRPDAAPFVFFDITRAGLGSEEFAERALRFAQVALAPGSMFGPAGEGYMRLALVEPVEILTVALQRLAYVTTTGARP
jgi:aminotransferase